MGGKPTGNEAVWVIKVLLFVRRGKIRVVGKRWMKNGRKKEKIHWKSFLLCIPSTLFFPTCAVRVSKMKKGKTITCILNENFN